MSAAHAPIPSASLDAPSAARSPWQRLYAIAHARRRSWYASRARRLETPVVSIGNLHWGGGGKTPLVAAVASHLRDVGHRVVILSRGYGRQDRAVRVVSEGYGPLLEPDLAGDEPYLLAEALAGVAVVVGADRFSAGRCAIEQLPSPPDLFLLDDGFSHVRLYRDLDVLAFPADDPFGGGRLLPSGRLREPLESVRFADAVVLTGATIDTGTTGGSELAAALRPFGFSGPGFVSHRIPELRPQTPASATATRTPFLLVSGVANPDSVADTAAEAGVQVAEHLVFPDHHAYPGRSLERIRDTLDRLPGVDTVLTTAKDRAKLTGRLDRPVAELAIEARPEEGFWRFLDEAVKGWEGWS